MIPIRSTEAAESILNGFLRSHRVLSVERRWVDQGENSFWSFCVDYLETSGAPASIRLVLRRRSWPGRAALG